MHVAASRPAGTRHAPHLLLGRLVRVTLRHLPLADLMQAYRSSPEAFQRQFGRPVHDLDTVLALAESSLTHGFSSYFDVWLRADDTVIGHLRVDWSLQEEGLISLHGGSPLDDPRSPGHRRRAQALARREAWHLMLRAALDTPGVQRVATATAASNRAAQAFIAASGFRRTRILQLPDGRETLIHYRLIREWFEAASGPNKSEGATLDGGLDPWRPARVPTPAGVDQAPAVATYAQAGTNVPIPPGWTRIDAASAAHWIAASPTDFLRHLADAPPARPGREDLVQTLFFEAANGTHFFGYAAGHTSSPAQALIAIKPLPDRAGWWVLRGGPFPGQDPPASLRPWLDACFDHVPLGRVEAQVPDGYDAIRVWWCACGLSEEGVTEIDRHGRPLAITLARIAP